MTHTDAITPQTSTGQVAGSAAVFTADAVLALDIEQALESISYRAWVGPEGGHIHSRQAPPRHIDVAIVDTRPGNTHSMRQLRWLSQEQVPTIIISSDDSDEDPALTAQQIIVGHFHLPLQVDLILPCVTAVANR